MFEIVYRENRKAKAVVILTRSSWKSINAALEKLGKCGYDRKKLSLRDKNLLAHIFCPTH